jgi:hypothetical protein
MHRYLLPLFLGAVAGCAALPTLGPPRTSMKIPFDREAMRAEVLKYLSPGMPIANAQRIMEDSGFRCEDCLLVNPPCLRCWTVQAQHFWVADEINVFLDHEDGKLTDIEVDCSSVGP